MENKDHPHKGQYFEDDTEMKRFYSAKRYEAFLRCVCILIGIGIALLLFKFVPFLSFLTT